MKLLSMKWLKILLVCLLMVFAYFYIKHENRLDVFRSWVCDPIPSSVRITYTYTPHGFLGMDPMAEYEFSVKEKDFRKIAERYDFLPGCQPPERMRGYISYRVPKSTVVREYRNKDLSSSEQLECYYTTRSPHCKECNENLFLFWDKGNQKAYFIGY